MDRPTMTPKMQFTHLNDDVILTIIAHIETDRQTTNFALTSHRMHDLAKPSLIHRKLLKLYYRVMIASYWGNPPYHNPLKVISAIAENPIMARYVHRVRSNSSDSKSFAWDRAVDLEYCQGLLKKLEGGDACGVEKPEGENEEVGGEEEEEEGKGEQDGEGQKGEREAKQERGNWVEKIRVVLQNVCSKFENSKDSKHSINLYKNSLRVMLAICPNVYFLRLGRNGDGDVCEQMHALGAYVNVSSSDDDHHHHHHHHLHIDYHDTTSSMSRHQHTRRKEKIGPYGEVLNLRLKKMKISMMTLANTTEWPKAFNLLTLPTLESLTIDRLNSTDWPHKHFWPPQSSKPSTTTTTSSSSSFQSSLDNHTRSIPRQPHHQQYACHTRKLSLNSLTTCPFVVADLLKSCPKLQSFKIYHGFHEVNGDRRQHHINSNDVATRLLANLSRTEKGVYGYAKCMKESLNEQCNFSNPEEKKMEGEKEIDEGKNAKNGRTPKVWKYQYFSHSAWEPDPKRQRGYTCLILSMEKVSNSSSASSLSSSSSSAAAAAAETRSKSKSRSKSDGSNVYE